ncbi:MAG: hypothetical protein IKG18_09235 [Atopobiaceae bacterium]|nr:hypothetical protein [Atopobiaceae bacterium]
MDLCERVHREVPEEERQNVRDAITECDDLELLRRLALGDAADWSWRMAAMERLAQIEPNHETKEALIAALRQVAEQGVLPMKRIAQARLSQIDRLDPSAGPETWGKTVFNPRLARYLHKHKGELDFESGYDLDLVEYAVCNRDDNFSSVDRRIAGVLYNLLPQERKDRVDGKVREYLGWHPSAGRYFLLKRLVEAETDADLLEDAVLATGGWPASFAFARLSGWSTYQEEDYWSFLTFECERLAGYPKERLEALTKRMIERGLLDE